MVTHGRSFQQLSLNLIQSKYTYSKYVYSIYVATMREAKKPHSVGNIFLGRLAGANNRPKAIENIYVTTCTYAMSLLFNLSDQLS